MLITEFVEGKKPDVENMHVCELLLSITCSKLLQVSDRLIMRAWDKLDRNMTHDDALEIITSSCVLFLRTICLPMPHIAFLAAQVQHLTEYQFLELRLLIKVFFRSIPDPGFFRRLSYAADEIELENVTSRFPALDKKHRSHFPALAAISSDRFIKFGAP